MSLVPFEQEARPPKTEIVDQEDFENNTIFHTFKSDLIPTKNRSRTTKIYIRSEQNRNSISCRRKHADLNKQHQDLTRSNRSEQEEERILNLTRIHRSKQKTIKIFQGTANLNKNEDEISLYLTRIRITRSRRSKIVLIPNQKRDKLKLKLIQFSYIMENHILLQIQRRMLPGKCYRKIKMNPTENATRKIKPDEEKEAVSVKQI
ncbi:hypothetical protein L2E82_50543 [Cichorium intybus]|nr:hypothetical protein L2E82_50543 [Cichorium intybus]